MLAAYLLNKPSGQPLVYLIVAVILFVLALIMAGVQLAGRNGATQALYRMLVSAGLGAVVLALLTH